MQSPSTALRPWPIVSGPVGLAETNSTITWAPAPAALVPKLAPSRSTRTIRSRQRARERKTFRKPGPGDLGALERAAAVAELGLEELRHLARRPADRLGQDQRGIAREVAVLGGLGRDHREARHQLERARRPLAEQTGGRIANELVDLVSHRVSR